MEIDPVLIEKAAKAESVEDLMRIAEENSIKLERETAELYYEKLNPPMGEIDDDEISSVTGGGCSSGGAGLELAPSKELYTGRKIYLKNEGHCFGASADYRPSLYCLKPGCYSRSFHIIKKVGDNGKYLIGCNNCDWTYYAMEDNIV